MKIYNMVNIPSGFTPEVDYDKIWQSGYTAGYDSGYTDAKETCTDPLKEYLTFEIVSGDTFKISACETQINYRVNKGDWGSVVPGWRGQFHMSVNPGDIIEVSGNASRYGRVTSGGNPYYLTFGGCYYNVRGNIMSLINSDPAVFSGLTKFDSSPIPTENEHTFSYMFRGVNVVDAGDLLLPATALTVACYEGMFYGCNKLIRTPKLPATVLDIDCYRYMFAYCNSLTTAPELPATTLTNNCYSFMFMGCTNLSTAPLLPAKTLIRNCYGAMFSDCTKLNNITCLAEGDVRDSDYADKAYVKSWLTNVSPTGTFITPHDTLWSNGGSGIPEGWTRVDAE